MGILTNRDIIRAAALDDYDALCEGIKRLFNCAEVDVDTDDGSVWIADPMNGHWLNADHLAGIADALRDSDI